MDQANEVRNARLCIDANDVGRITEFWTALLGYRVRETDATDTWRHLEPPSPILPKLTIQPVGEAKTVKNRLHLDLFVADPGPWIERCVELGGTTLWMSDEPGDWFQVIGDPEGNEFCICRTNVA